MDGYLFDTNAVSALWNARHPEHDTVKTFFAGVSQSPVWLSTIVLAEIEYGIKITPEIDIDSRDQVRREMSKHPLILDIDKHTIALVPIRIYEQNCLRNFRQEIAEAD
jgi:predicted nucleic acid-binding protein